MVHFPLFNRTSDKLSNYAINGNAKLGKFGLSVFLNAGYSDPVAQYNINTTIPTIPNVYSQRTLEGNQYTSSDWSFGNAELSWELDSSQYDQFIYQHRQLVKQNSELIKRSLLILLLIHQQLVIII